MSEMESHLHQKKRKRLNQTEKATLDKDADQGMNPEPPSNHLETLSEGRNSKQETSDQDMSNNPGDGVLKVEGEDEENNPNLKIDLEKLEAEYEKKRVELSLWRQRRQESIRSFHSKIIYRLFTFWPNQFAVDNGKTACGCISLLAIYNYLRFYKEHPFGRYPTDLKWSTLVELGANVWTEWKASTRRHRNFQDVIEIYKMPQLERLRDVITPICEIGGSLDNDKLAQCNLPAGGNQDQPKSFLSLEEAVHEITKNKIHRTGATVTMRSSTYSILYDGRTRPEEIWLFDSHGGHDLNHSSLLKFEHPKYLVRFLRKKHPIVETKEDSIHDNKSGYDENSFFFLIFGRTLTVKSQIESTMKIQGDTIQ